ncbi:zinc-binding dehydrogenase [Propionicicella superfundia]|uniref:zinc-binding dehydrogenase n=1 Tax=Propionicicella superfundia TaxID=348582 RepID=UPI00048D1B4E|nr:alcohol dehydrogenase catalytic domain-containing protein [Propionicicella superfundia]
MLAAVMKGPGQLDVMEVPTPEPGPGELLLKVGSNTVCGTDLRILKGEKTTGVRPGVVLGHEIAGTIAAVGEGVTGYAVGDLAVITPVVTCGNCWFCLRELEHFCEKSIYYGYALDGGLAEYCLAPEFVVKRKNVTVAKPGTPLTALSLVEPLGCVLNGLTNYKVFLGDTAVILGAGPIGLLHLTVCRLAGATQIIMSDPSESRRATAKALGADIVVDPLNEDLLQVVKDATSGRGADVCVIAIGRLELFAQALDLVRLGGRVCAFAGFPKGGSTGVDPNVIHYNEITVTGTSNSKRRHTEEAIHLIESGLIPADVIVSHTFPLEKAVEAIEFVSSGEGIKIAVVPE